MQQNLAVNIINKAISGCTEKAFKFDNKKLFLFSHYFSSNFCNLHIEQEKVGFRTCSAIHLQPADIVQIDMVLEYKTSLLPSVQFDESNRVTIAPEIHQDPQLRISNLSIYNLTNELVILKPETFLFSINFHGIDGIMAVPVNCIKIVTSSHLILML